MQSIRDRVSGAQGDGFAPILDELRSQAMGRLGHHARSMVSREGVIRCVKFLVRFRIVLRCVCGLSGVIVLPCQKPFFAEGRLVTAGFNELHLL